MSIDYHALGSKPEALAAHIIEKTYELTGISPEDFIRLHAADQFNYLLLQNEFKKHCMDYCDDLQPGLPSLAVDFCAKIVFEIGPESRKIKKGTSDKVWKFIRQCETCGLRGHIQTGDV